MEKRSLYSWRLATDSTGRRYIPVMTRNGYYPDCMELPQEDIAAAKRAINPAEYARLLFSGIDVEEKKPWRQKRKQSQG